MEKQNAPARKGRGADCRLVSDFSVSTTAAVRIQYLGRLGLPSSLATAIAPLCFGEAAI